jgi:hypothetical protein
MKIDLLIQDDAELRAFIKESIKNEIVSIAHREVREVISQALASATKEKTLEGTVDRIAREELEKVFRHQRLDAKEMACEYIRERMDEAVTAAIDPEQIAGEVAARLRDVSVIVSTKHRAGIIRTA